MSLPSSVKLVEVGPRDGLQNEHITLDVETKVEFVNRLSKTGLNAIEVGSFVRADRIPQMADSDRVFSKIEKHTGVSYPVLVPNVKGLERALAVGANEIAIFASASEHFSQKNINCSIVESLERFNEISSRAKSDGVRIRAYVSCIAGCPYEGEVKADAVIQVASELIALGCYEVSLGDTIGVGTPEKIVRIVELLSSYVPIEKIALHCHDTYGQALANIYAGLQSGIAVIDSAVSGLGGCPYAKGATGNVASEDVLYMLDGLGIETGVDIEKLCQVGQYISQKLGRKSHSKVTNATLRAIKT